MGVLTSLPKPAQRVLLRPEIASFLVKISSTSKTCDMSDICDLLRVVFMHARDR